MKWLLLAGAIVTEVSGSLAMKGAIEHPAWFVVVGVGYVTSFVFLWAVLRAGMPLGVAYGIWGALGVALTAGIAGLLFGEPLTPLMIGGMVLVIAGVLTVELGSQRAHDQRERAEGSRAGRAPVGPDGGSA